MISRIVSGGQTGADIAGLRAARLAGIPTGGWAPLGWLTEDGPAPWLAGYGLEECQEPGYQARTRANARDSDATVWFGTVSSPGFQATAKACRTFGRPLFVVRDGETKPSMLADWLNLNGFTLINIAGNRESRSPGIGARVERFLGKVFTFTQ